MAISFNEFLSQASSGDYRQGLGKDQYGSIFPTAAQQVARGRHPRGALVPSASHFPCMACGKARPTDRLPCPHCKQNKGWARCGGVSLGGLGCGVIPGGRAVSGCFSGLGSTTVIQGQGDLEPGDYGQQYVMTTKPNTTVMSKRHGVAPVARRQNITRMITELEFLAGTPGIHERVLAQKVWQARKALMGTSKWSWANYQSQRSSYDSYDDLVSRLDAVEGVLGTRGVSAKAMSQLYGAGMGGLGSAYTGAYQGAPWGASGDPVAKLASCIRGVLCQPKAFCCPPGQRFEDPYYDEFPGFEDEFPDFATAAGGGGGGGGTWIGGDPKETWIPPEETWIPPKKPQDWVQPPPPPPPPPPPKRPVTGGYLKPNEPVIKVGQDVRPPPPKPPRRPVTGGGVTYGRTPTPPKPLVGGAGRAITPGVLVGGAGRPVTGGGILYGGGGGGGAGMVSMAGLGARRPSALNTLVAQLRAARLQVRRAR